MTPTSWEHLKGLFDRLRPLSRSRRQAALLDGDLDASQRHHADSGVLQLGSNQFRQIFLNLVRDATEPGRIFRHLLNRVKVEWAVRDN